MNLTIRTVLADEWEKARELRLAALLDPVAHLAFLETHEDAAARPDDFWQERTASASTTGEGRVRQFVAEAPDGRWLGTVTVLVERPADEVRFGEPAKVDQTHLVGVYVRPEARGAGVIDALFRAAVEWSWTVEGIRRVRLYVHEENARAAAFYRRFGFVPSGERVPMPGDTGAYEDEYELAPRPSAARHGGYVLRAIRSGEWEQVRELRLAALRDPLAPLAFVESYEEAAARPDGFWQERAEGGSEDGGTRIRQFVAEGPDGRWAGTVTVFVELPEDGKSLFGDEVTVPQVDVVGVYVRPEARGSGLVDALFATVLEWAWALDAGVERARLYVHEENVRAAAAYRRLGFVATGGRADTVGAGELHDLEYVLPRP